MRFASLATLALLLLPLAATAQVYKWKDASGKVHYSDQPPAEAKLRGSAIAPSGDASADTASAPKISADKRLEASKQAAEAKEKAAKAEKERAEDAQRQQACERARTNLQGLQSGQIRFRMSPTGEREALDGAVRDAELAEAQRAVDTSCAARPTLTAPAAPTATRKY